MNWTLLIVIFVIAACGFAGYRKGLIKIVISMVSLILTIVLVGLITPYISTAIEQNTKIYDSMYNKTEEYINNLEVKDGIDKGDDSVISQLPLPTQMKESIKDNNTLEKYTSLGVNSFKEYLATVISKMIFKATVFIIAFINDDFPTLDFPASTISGKLFFG